MEIWKDISGYEGMYQVSDFGNIKSLSRTMTKGVVTYKSKEIILKAGLTGKGYLALILCKNKIRKSKKIHQLVAIAFLNHKPCGNKLVVNHINCNKIDNRLVNLEIVTNRENTNKKHLESSSKYVGVSWCKRDKKWTSMIQINGKIKNLGRFKIEKDAHNAYQKALSNIN